MITKMSHKPCQKQLFSPHLQKQLDIPINPASPNPRTTEPKPPLRKTPEPLRRHSSIHKRLSRGRAIPPEKIYLLNELFYDKQQTLISTMRLARTSQALLDRALFHCKEDWEAYKKTLQPRAPDTQLQLNLAEENLNGIEKATEG